MIRKLRIEEGRWKVARPFLPSSILYLLSILLAHPQEVTVNGGVLTLSGSVLTVGTESGFTPTSRGGQLVAWYKADAGIYEDAGTDPAEDGDTIRQWNDQSGNGYHLGQSVTSDKPLFQTSIQNSLAGVECVSTDFFTNHNPPFATAPITIYMVGTSSDAANLQYPIVIGCTGSGSAGWYLGWHGAGAGDPFVWNAVDSSGVGAATTTGYTAGTPYIATGQEASTTSRSIWINGGSVGTNTGAKNPLDGCSMDRFFVGAQRGLQPFLGFIFEIVVVANADDATQRAQMHTYLSTKWGL